MKKRIVLTMILGLFVLATPAQTFNVLKRFTDTNVLSASQPMAGMVLANGVLYGTTSGGGGTNYGTLFKINTDGSGYQVLMNFTTNHDSSGGIPLGDLLISGGTLYGTASAFGANGGGTLFKVDTNGAHFQVLHSFDNTSAADGNTPAAGLVLSGNRLYGTTQNGGTSGNGTVFQVDTNGGNYQVLVNFQGTAGGEGSAPMAALTLSGNTLYGVTTGGGPALYGVGVIFQVNTDGSGYNTLTYFDNANGATPSAALTLSGGTLYGTTANGGANSGGTIFKINTDGTGFTKLRDLDPNASEASIPLAPLLLQGNVLIGSSAFGGKDGMGTLFKLNTDGSGYTNLYEFPMSLVSTNGANPQGGLVLANGTLYGTAPQGGNTNPSPSGVVYSFALPPGVLPDQPPAVSNPLTNLTVNQDVTNNLFNLTLNFSDAETPAANLLYAVVRNTNTALITVSITNGTNLLLVFAPNASGTSQIGVSATDAGGLSATNFFTVTVNAVNHTPSFSLPPEVVAWGGNSHGETTVPAGLSGVTAIAAGQYYTAALKNDGTVMAWGENYLGQTNVPAGLTNVTAIAAGASHMVALRQGGTVVAWGYNYNGQATVPTGLTNVVAIAAGAYHTVALRQDGIVAAWGLNDFGQTTVPAGLTNVTAIAATVNDTVALKQDGTVVAWGVETATVPPGLSNVTAIATGGGHMVALKNDGTVVAWGDNSHGETDVPAGLSGVTAIAAGYAHTVALKKDGTVVAWGAGMNSGLSYNYGQTNVPAGLTGVTAIAAGATHTVALRAGIAVAANSGPQTLTHYVQNIAAGPTNESGQTLTFNVVSNSNPALFSIQPVISSDGTVTFTSATNATGSAAITITLSDNGGTNYGGADTSAPQTFKITVTPNSPPVLSVPITNVLVNAGAPNLVSNLTLNFSDAETPAAKLMYAVVLNTNSGLVTASITNGTNLFLIFTPGTNGSSQIGVSATDAGGLSVTNYFLVTVNPANHAPGFILPPEVVAWGYNDQGETTVPAGLSGVTAIAAGGYHTVALKNDGTVVAWGDNSYGQTTVPAGLSNVTAIAAGGFHTVAFKKDGTVVAWGAVDGVNDGQTTVPAGLSNVTAIAAGAYHTVALKKDGTVVAWGYSDKGQTNVPAGLTNVTAIAASGSHTVALKNDGTVVAWGYNGYGQRTVPAGLSGVTAIAAGGFHTVALRAGIAVAANSGPQTLTNYVQNITAGPTSESSQTVAFNVVSNSNAGLFSVTPAVSSDGTVRFTPAAGQFGNASVTLQAQDNGGTAGGGQDTSAPQTFTIEIRAVSTFTNLTQTFDGTPRSVTLTTLPAGAATNTVVTYNGSTNPPTAEGSYYVVAKTTVGGVSYISGSGTLVIGAAVQSAAVNPGAHQTVSALGTGGKPSVSVTATNQGSSALQVSAATYSGKPATVGTFGFGSSTAASYVDVRVSGADSNSTLTVKLYYPTNITGTVETKLALTYWNGQAFVPVLSTGGAAPVKNTTDNLDGTTSGGRFTVTFDATSTPKITDLNGTVLMMAPMATITLGNLTQIYDGSVKTATASTTPSGLSVDFLYNGTTLQPTEPGSYTVDAGISDTNYVGAASGTLVITVPLAQVVSGSGGNCQFSVPGSGTWVVQGSTNLADPAAWVDLITNTAPFTFVETNPPGLYPQRFYRATLTTGP